jgi:hypothetical protein
MRNIVKVVNTDVPDVVVGVRTFSQGVPVTVYRDINLYKPPSNFLAFLQGFMTYENGQKQRGPLRAYDFDGVEFGFDESLQCLQRLNQETKMFDTSSQSPGFYWVRTACEEIHDGFKRQLNVFDWGSALVDRAMVHQQLVHVHTAVAATDPDMAIEQLELLIPETESTEFLTQARIDSFVELFEALRSTPL